MTRGHTAARAAALIGALLVLLALVLAACSTPMDEAAARKAATEYYMNAPHEGDTTPVDVLIEGVRETTRDARAGWEVQISGRIVMPGLPEGYVSAMILFVDSQTGAVTVVARG
jgi:uncharacterized protein YcnI